MVNRSVQSPFVTDAAIQVPFSITSGGKIADTSLKDKVWEYRVKSLLGTAVGERTLRPLYGIDLTDIEFNTQSIASEIITREIQTSFSRFLEELSLEDVSISFDEATSIMSVTVTYTLPDNTLSTTTVGVARINNNSPISEV